MEPDFSGWATKAGLKCSDGRTIMPGAFKHQDRVRVPLVWQHGHTDPENVLGHVMLEDREGSVYAYAFFNGSKKAQHSKGLVQHKDITMLSIWANNLVEKARQVVHGSIREVSLVLSGANPGALIENVSIAHDGGSEILDDEAVIYTGLPVELSHSDEGGGKPGEAKHADGDNDGGSNSDDEKTLQDVYESLSDEQKDLVHYMIGTIVKDGPSDDNNNDDNGDNSVAQDNVTDQNKEGTDVGTRNVFEKGDEGKPVGQTLSHSDMAGIFHAAQQPGQTLKSAVEAYASDHLQHGIEDIETLFPEATAVTAAPEFFKRRTEWVSGVIGGATKTPFSRVKTHWADLNFDDARAKGYVKGSMKKEEFFGTARRVTTPQTVYKKQKLDRDDIIDITDFNVVSWMKGEMRLMLEEEIARAILIGDGRSIADEDKISETNIRPIATDDDLFTVVVNVNIDDASSTVEEIIDALILQREFYRGTGQPVMYTTQRLISQMLLLKDSLGRKLYRNKQELASDLDVSALIPVEVMNNHAEVLAILVDMKDYSIGADRGGQTTMFDDFDIDFNQYKYLIETRMSGALTKLKSAMVVKKVDSADVLVDPVTAPTFDTGTGVITIPTQTGVQYEDQANPGVALTAGAQAALSNGETFVVVAVPTSGYYFATSEEDEWTFTYRA